MHKRFFFVLGLIALSLISVLSSAGAQGVDWQVTVFNGETSTFYTITASGIQPGPVLPGAQNFQQIYGMRVSPDGIFAVFNGTMSDTDPGGAYIANLASGACCVKLQDPAQPGMQPTFIGPFSPDGSQIAVSLLDNSSLGQSQTPNAAIVVFDLASGSIIASTPLSSIQPQESYAAAAAFGEWKADGIRVVPSCWGCEGVWNGSYSIWNPTANTMSAPVEPFDIFLDKLPVTGETLKSAANDVYPQSGAPGGYFPPANVVEYSAGVNQPEQVIYFNENNPYVASARWVYDGRAILVQLAGPAASYADNPFVNEEPGEAYLLFRDGRQVTAPSGLGSVMIGTPDGWIALDWNTNTLSRVQIDDNGNSQVTLLGNGPRWDLASNNFTLGTSAAPAAFPLVPPPARTTCPGFMESRLWANSFARVTPGAANNLRADPATTSALLTSIPGEGVFAVLEGPVCTENMAWWKVQYNGQMGWTAEGQGTSYWVEPMTNVW